MAINFPIVTTFDDKATKKADKAFGALGRKFAAVFSVAAVIMFGKESVKAFQEAEKEAALLRSQLEAINLGFASPLVNEYIDNLALLSGVTGGDLTNAFVSLSQATEDATTAQELLSTALDISAGTGKSLQSVTNALQRAYKGEVTSLAKLRIGFTATELKGKKFNDVLDELNERFTGASARAADTYAGKIARLKEAVDQAQEAFGKGLVSGIEESGQSIEDLQQDIINLGEALGGLAADVNNFASDTIAAFDRIGKSAAVQGLLDVFDALVRGVGFVITGELVPSMDQATARLAGEERRKNEESNRAVLRTKSQLIRAEKEITKNKKEQEKLTDKDKKNALAIAKAKAIFDIEKIQIEAALQGKITEEERKRLLLMRAILQEDAVTATKLAKELNDLQTNTQKLADTLINIGKMPSPFSSWKDDVIAAIDAINDGMKKSVTDFIADFRSQIRQVPQEVIMQSLASQAEADMMLGDYYAALAQLGESKAELEVLYGQFGGNLVKSLSISEKQLIDKYFRDGMTGDIQNPFRSDVDLNEIIQQIIARNELYKTVRPSIDAIGIQEESVAALGALAAEAAARAADDLLQESILGNLNLGLTPEMNITVNVEGSVISAEDLAETITDIQYEYQRSGKNLLLSSTKL